MKKSDRQEQRLPEAAGDALPARLDRRAMEQQIVALGRLVESQKFGSIEEANAYLANLTRSGGRIVAPPPTTPVARAQEVMYDAWAAQGKKRVELAQQALTISPDCADAYVLLAEETAQTAAEAHVLYTKAVAAGERALGAKAFKDLVGQFWGVTETRPYMRARLGLASTLWQLGQREAAIAHFQDMLRLNPGDNQGIRYVLLSSLVNQKRDPDARKLIERFASDGSAGWLYSRALLAFRGEGDTRPARQLLLAALKAGPFVPVYMLGLHELPPSLPDTLGFGDATEGQAFVVDFGSNWFDTAGAMDWMVQTIGNDKQTQERVAAAVVSLVTPDEMMAYTVKSWRKEQDSKPIGLDTKLQAALNKCPAAWIDGIFANLEYKHKALKREKVAAIVAHLTGSDTLRKAVSALPAKGRGALALVLTNGWVKYGDLTRRFGKEDGDGWWWAEEPPTSVLGQVRLAGLLFVGTAGMGGRNYTVAVIPIELRPLLQALLPTL